ncbi:hypothetical protein [Mucilaginibacter flavus]|uniref:hypothetical protein n=1 Tax=Mucilaginibacter flavus TaxID=931504 RepID=UPI0025B3083A|nr:hypothetical protein [Mucilaginibacter flavus]MDN3580916.1 hypothetical protein [Mucilaginibacter flavus]
MKIKKGIGIHNSLHQKFGAVSINTGSCYADEQQRAPVVYGRVNFIPKFQDGAILPKSDWRPLSESEQKMLRPPKPSAHYNTIFLGELTEQQVQHLKELKLTDATTLEDIYALFRRNELVAKQLNDDLNVFLHNISGNKPYKFHCFGATYPNLASVSRLQKEHFPKDVRYLGLHNDCTSAMSIHTAQKFGNRISINLGKQAREFLFVNLSLKQAYNMIKKKSSSCAAQVDLITMPRIFFSLYPEYPVLKIKLNPYQYYIAPTNNCFHDAQTLGNQFLDITMIFFGTFFIS